MSKESKNFNRIQTIEKHRALKNIAKQYSKDNKLDDVTAPSVEKTEGIIRNEYALDQVLFEIKVMCEQFTSNFDDGDFNTDKIKKELRMIKATCTVAIAKIETGW